MSQAELQGLRRRVLFTRDAHALYQQFGFGEARHPERLMEVFNECPYGVSTRHAPTPRRRGEIGYELR